MCHRSHAANLAPASRGRGVSGAGSLQPGTGPADGTALRQVGPGPGKRVAGEGERPDKRSPTMCPLNSDGPACAGTRHPHGRTRCVCGRSTSTACAPAVSRQLRRTRNQPYTTVQTFRGLPAPRRPPLTAMASRTACWCSASSTPRPDRHVAHTRSRSGLGIAYQSRRHIKRDPSITSPQPGTGHRLPGEAAPETRPGPHPRPASTFRSGTASRT
jgi:hypothetical protein